jgi:uncharacterized membrane protein
MIESVNHSLRNGILAAVGFEGAATAFLVANASKIDADSSMLAIPVLAIAGYTVALITTLASGEWYDFQSRRAERREARKHAEETEIFVASTNQPHQQ